MARLFDSDEETVAAPAPAPPAPPQSSGPRRSYLSGESVMMLLPRCLCVAADGIAVVGALEMTTYRLRFLREGPPGSLAHMPATYFEIALGCVRRLRTLALGDGGWKLTLRCKDVREVAFVLPEAGAEAAKLLRAVAFREDPGAPGAAFFALAHPSVVPAPGATETRWWRYDAEASFAAWLGFRRSRDNVLFEAPVPWRLSGANAGRAVCASYPELLVVPAAVGDGQVAAAGKFRAEGRVPALTWGDARDGASVWRASQPKVGVAGATSASDEALVRAIASADGGERRAVAAPLRDHRLPPAELGVGEQARGLRHGGPRPLQRVPALVRGRRRQGRKRVIQVRFNVGNIHAVRAAHKALEALALDARGSRGGGGEDAEAPAPEPGSSSLSGRVWAAVAKAPDKERDREKRPGDDASHSVFDDEGFDASRELGWLGLVAALAQLLLDAECRTMRGFARLVEKDFVAFGPPLTALFPEHFEFGSAYLVAVADAAHGCRFGTFLFDTEGDREAHAPHAPSLWAYLDHNRAHFASAAYRPPAPDLAARAPTSEHALLPPLTVVLRGVGLWRDYFLRYSPAPSVDAGVARARRDGGGGDDGEPAAHPDCAPPPPTRAPWQDALAAAEEEARFWKKRADVAGQRADRSRLFNMLVDPDA
ncbi:phosphatidylinositol-3,5-bisphosphate 3-phosphatase [Aureococcus anophagefferens]|nr:phosphatidylinositol-3,5-bisphosphate 3-phosphatase [Aureococcus anophagefferens]